MPNKKTITLLHLAEKEAARLLQTKRGRHKKMVGEEGGLARLVHLKRKGFWSRVKIGPKNECWPYLGSRLKATAKILPYGIARLFNYWTTAHRAAYLFYHGSIPDGLNVLHKCDNPPCCNPDHLFTGTQKDNMLDCSSKGRLGGVCLNKLSKLTAPEVLQIRELLKSGCTLISIGKTFGVSYTTVGDIKRGKTWS